MNVVWNRVRTPHRGAIVAAAGLAAVAAAYIVFGRNIPWPRRSDAPSSERAALVAAVGRQRPIEARLVGGFRHGPVPARLRGADRPLAGLEVAIAIARLRKAAAVDDASMADAAAAAGALVAGDADAAVAALEDVVKLSPAEAAYENDLSAAYLERARRLDRAEDLPRAVAAADRAITRDPRLAEAWFNRALGLEQLFLRDEARIAWADALRCERDAEWADEIRQHLARLTPPAADVPWSNVREQLVASLAAHDVDADRQLRDHRELAREWIEDDLLPAWGRARIAGDRPRAEEILGKARLLARALVRVDGDGMPADGIALLDRAAANATLTADLARAHEAFGRARELFLNDRLREAGDTLNAVESSFDRANSPYLFWSRVYRAFAARAAGHNDEALAIVDTIPPRALTRFRYLRGRAMWIAGAVHLSEGRIDLTDREYKTAYQAFEEGGEREMKAAIAALRAENLFYLGRSEDAWQMERQAVSELDHVRTAARRYTVVYYGAFVATSQDLPEVAWHYLNTVVRNAEAIGDRNGIPEALIRRARVADALQLRAQVEQDLSGAAMALNAVEDPGLRRRWEVELTATRGQLRGGSAGIDDLSTAIDYFRPAHHSIRLVRLLLARGRAAASDGDDRRAEQDLVEGIGEFEQQRSAWPDEQVRMSSFDEAWSLFDEAMKAAMRRGQPEEALAIAERGRARALLDTLAHTTEARPDELSAMQRRLPPSVRVVYYRVLADETLIWTIAADDISVRRVRVGRPTLERAIHRVQMAVAQPDAAGAFRPAARALYDAFVAPIEERIPAGARLAIVGDDVVQRVPFAGLIGPDGHYLIERHDVVWAPSLSVLTRESSPPAPRGDEPVLVTAPAGGRALEPLPDAKEEAQAIGRLYRRATILTGDHVTTKTFLHDAADYAIVHFAGHSVVNEQYPALSYLVMSAETPDADAGRLFSYEIARERWTRTRLVVLASCSGAAGPSVRGEGVLSLARPFLAAGVPAVVAAQWPLDDRMARLLFTAMHREVSAGVPVSTALRHAQLERLQEPDAFPGDWGGVVAVGQLADLVNPHERN
jgi:CHAT domain-containing protein/tetratricopeptide (TPR) repeat protein